MKTCEMSCIKYLLFAFNLIFAISGIGIIVAGSLVLCDVDQFSHFLEDRILAPPVVLIVVGAIIFFIAFLGCFGAIRESHGLLIAFSVCLVIIFVVELAVGIVAAVYKSDFEDGLRDAFKSSMAKYNTNDVDKAAWENIQTKLKCCGTDTPQDWSETQVPVPPSCCMNSTGQTSRTGCSGTFYQTGCLEKVKQRVAEKSSVLVGVGIGIAFVQVAGVILACLLASTIRREQNK